MEILTLDIQNFMSLGSAQLELASKGLCLIQGKNEDDSSAKSNGSGKSSIPDALSWCLFGETARGASGDAIINRSAGKGTLVRAVLGNEAREVYSVTRARKHKVYKNRLAVYRWPDAATARKNDISEAVDLTLGTDRLTQDLVVKILGCSLEVFNAAIYAGQERMPNLPGMTDKQLKELIEEAAGIALLQEAYAESRRLHVDATQRANKAQTEMLAEARAVASLKEQIEKIKLVKAEWSDKQKQAIAVIQKQLQVAEKNMKDFATESVVKTAELTDVIAQQTTLRAALSENRGRIDKLKAFEVQVRKLENSLIADKSSLNVLAARSAARRRKLGQRISARRRGSPGLLRHGSARCRGGGAIDRRHPRCL